MTNLIKVVTPVMVTLADDIGGTMPGFGRFEPDAEGHHHKVSEPRAREPRAIVEQFARRKVPWR